MTAEAPLAPTDAQLALIAAYPDSTPFVMINLLKFRGDEGRERYWREYSPRVGEIVRNAGGRSLWKGAAEHLIVGAPPHDWDGVWLVAWPSKREFIAMMSHPDFEATQAIRERSLERTALILSTERATTDPA